MFERSPTSARDDFKREETRLNAKEQSHAEKGLTYKLENYRSYKKSEKLEKQREANRKRRAARSVTKSQYEL